MACNFIAEASAWVDRALPAVDWTRSWLASATTFTLIAAAEFGDKSQLVCMALAARHRHWPVWWGALAAFALLNGIAVAFGATVGRWLPEPAVALAVAVLFAIFGIHALMTGAEKEVAASERRTGRNLFATTFLMIFLAEFGDKTQIAVAGLSAAEPSIPVWLGATLALAATSAVGIWAGRTILQKLPQRTLHKAGGFMFLGFAVLAGFRAIPWETWDPLLKELKELGLGF
jgi:putative Ca2+/H+ antiporter (TMEM165/GDT1 family)